MKNLWYKKIENSMVVFLIFLVMTSSSEAKDLSAKFAINGKIGYFLPTINSDVDRFYRGGRVVSLEGEYNLSPAFSIILCLDYKELDFNEREDWEVAKVEEDYLRIIPVTFSLIYNMPIGNQKDFLPYIGGGIGVYRAKLKLEVSEIPNQYIYWRIVEKRGKFPMFEVSKSNPSDSKSARDTGFHLLGGFKYHLFSHLFLNGEIKYAYASISKWNDIDVGGITVVGGINYLF